MSSADFFTPMIKPTYKLPLLGPSDVLENDTSKHVVIDTKPELLDVKPESIELDTKILSSDVIIDVKPEITEDLELKRRIDADYSSMTLLYDDMTNVNKMRSKNSEEIKTLNDSFRQQVDNFKKNYGPIEIYNSEIKKFEESIFRGQHRNLTLGLFDEPSNFNGPISIKSYSELNIITNITMIDKFSATTSFIFKAKYLDKPCYIKSFFITEENLIYEQKIYHYIETRNEQIKPYYEDYFVKVYDTIKVACVDFQNLLDSQNVKINRPDFSPSWNTNYDFRTKLHANIYIYLIITEDTGGITYKEFFEKNYDNENLIINTLFDMIYGIYLMNNKLKIMHNDNHFGNVLIKIDLPQTESKYQIEKIEYAKTKNFRLCFYDFDLAFLQDELNPHLSSNWLVQNKKSAKDIWTLLNSILGCMRDSPKISPEIKSYFINKIFGKFVTNKKFWRNQRDLSSYKKLDYIGNLVFVILDHSQSDRDKLIKILVEHARDGKFWNAYCVNNEHNPCIIPDEPLLYPLPVLYRLIKDEHYGEILGFTNVDPFYKKYSKYKSKYLELKANKK